MRNKLSLRPSWVAAAIAVGLAFGTLGVSLVVADRAGCSEVAAGSISESASFVPYEDMRTKPVDALIGDPLDSATLPARAAYAQQAIDGLARQFTVHASNGSVYSYFLDRDTAGLTRSDFLKLGGLELHQDAAADSFAAYLLTQLGDRAVPIKLVTFDAALTWGDPDVKGTRSHGLYWFDGTYNYALIGDRSATALVNIARNMVCNG